MFLLAIIFATSYSFAQQGQKVNPEKPIFNDPPVMVTKAACPVPPVVVNVTQNNNSSPSPMQKTTTAKSPRYRSYKNSSRWDNTWYVPTQHGILSIPQNGSISGSFNTTTNNNNYYGFQGSNQLQKNCFNVCGGNHYGHGQQPYQIDWFPGFWFWLLLAVGLGLWFWDRRNPIFPPKSDPAPIKVIMPTPAPASVSKTEYPAPVKPAVDLTEMPEKLKGTGGRIRVNADGSVVVDFPKDSGEKKPGSDQPA